MRVQVDDKIRQECELSYYHTIGVLNEAHEVFYVQHKENHKIYVKRICMYTIGKFMNLSGR